MRIEFCGAPAIHVHTCMLEVEAHKAMQFKSAHFD